MRAKRPTVECAVLTSDCMHLQCLPSASPSANIHSDYRMGNCGELWNSSEIWYAYCHCTENPQVGFQKVPYFAEMVSYVATALATLGLAREYCSSSPELVEYFSHAFCMVKPPNKMRRPLLTARLATGVKPCSSQWLVSENVRWPDGWRCVGVAVLSFYGEHRRCARLYA